MTDKYTIAEARHNLASLVHEVEERGTVELTRRGRPVAVLMSMREFERLRDGGTGFVRRLADFRHEAGELPLDGEELEGLRDPSPGREVDR